MSTPRSGTLAPPNGPGPAATAGRGASAGSALTPASTAAASGSVVTRMVWSAPATPEGAAAGFASANAGSTASAEDGARVKDELDTFSTAVSGIPPSLICSLSGSDSSVLTGGLTDDPGTVPEPFPAGGNEIGGPASCPTDGSGANQLDGAPDCSGATKIKVTTISTDTGVLVAAGTAAHLAPASFPASERAPCAKSVAMRGPAAKIAGGCESAEGAGKTGGRYEPTEKPAGRHRLSRHSRPGCARRPATGPPRTRTFWRKTDCNGVRRPMATCPAENGECELMGAAAQASSVPGESR